jgi:predicted ATPase
MADVEARARNIDRAIAILDEALAMSEQIGHRAFDAEVHRVRGEMLLKRDPADLALAEEAFRAAIAVARAQRARSFDLRAAFSLAKLYQSIGRSPEAHAVLVPTLEGFEPTPEMPEIAEAQAVLSALAESRQVKDAEAHRQRRVHLQTAYGNALIAARGYGAPETTEAFAKARGSGSSPMNTPERFAINYGLWVGSFLRGELSSQRAHAAEFLSDVGRGPDTPEAGIAHRVAGLTNWFAGEYREAREHLERALLLFTPGRDDDFAFRFGNDPGAAAMLYLALALWPMGDVSRAISLVRDAEARRAGLAHINTRAYGILHASMFALMRDDPARAASDATELATLSREHNLPLWRAFAVFFEGLASAQNGASAGGLEDMRRGVALLREQSVPLFDGLLKVTLAESEAGAGDVNRAIAILDEALATSEQIGHHVYDAELHRVRGKMLLKRDPTNPGPAEQALQTAVAVAQRQGTLSFELRATLSLVKLYRSTGHPADARAMLAPPLEGFAPTAEMPEIAEVLALLREPA